ncbi:orotate phosphoribosyltransferase [Methanothrix harundinacea]|uniref:orotate phosphoribosyltransferase n=1 Tax=Methanothrix harundinacea TaxID=301375 RepID=UPI0009DB2173|nr:orotate phosphoribosyltransferase [Methanothrix harundinacea]
MELLGICSSCGAAGKLFTCQLCGGLVCARCLDPGSGVCRQCAGGRRAGDLLGGQD